ncbi:hypothetical protein MFMK1_001156 [Metallumcola ferriviriculae]|uniref:Double-GTPase 2 domain-containing protein n=1 Tax=Metallumcola ferriviriculae TaxID=3039180 RepID=A0AAU0UL76_9FIRM|nr:hypothetical protein MFMK1_001156 [Desulfitibacteraceae bacterium MK1]
MSEETSIHIEETAERDIVEQIDTQTEVLDAHDDIFELPHGNALELDETYEITAANKTNFIVLIGPAGCGKTTLVTTVYQMFQKNPMEDYYFAGSRTLLGFEQRAFLTRTTSGHAFPDTPKTRRGISDSILHLKLYSVIRDSFKELLITDFSGEDYKAIIANVNLAKEEFGVIKRADNLVLLIDGELVSNKKRRNGAVQETLELLKTIIDAGLFSNRTCLDIVISKYDIVKERSIEDSAIKDFLSNVQQKFINKFGNEVMKLNFYYVSAMPKDKNQLNIGYGLDKLINSWVERKMGSVGVIQSNLLKQDFKSEFNLFKIRTYGV